MADRSMEDRQVDLMTIANGLRDDIMASLNSSVPGIIQSFNADEQTAVVQVAIRRRVKTDAGVREEKEPLLVDVPVCFLGGGGKVLTFPIQAGDECLVFFADRCIDAWWQSGGVQNQVMPRMHDISDGFALVGFRSRPKRVQGFNTDEADFIGGVMVDGKKPSVEGHNHDGQYLPLVKGLVSGDMKFSVDYGMAFYDSDIKVGSIYQASGNGEYYVNFDKGAKMILHEGNFLDRLHPVGSVYHAVTDTIEPDALFGGVWSEKSVSADGGWKWVRLE